MTDRTIPSTLWTPPDTGRRRSGPERPGGRAIGVALVAAGLALSVSLYPLPDGPKLFDLLRPDQESSSKTSKVDDSTVTKFAISDFTTVELLDLVKLVGLNRDFPDLATGDLLGLVTTYGLSNVVKSLEVLHSFSPPPTNFPSPSGGGGGGSSGAVGETWPALMILLEFLEQNAPNPSGFSLWDVATSILPNSMLSLGIPPALAAEPPEIGASELAAAQFVTPIEASAPGPPDPPDSGSAAAPTAAPTAAPVAAPHRLPRLPK